MRPTVLALPMLLLLSPALQAGETPWQEVAPDVSLRLISTGAVSDLGKTMLALELNMPESTKTYWRVPGQAGLPTEIDLDGSTGIVGFTQRWPYPLRHEQGGLLDYVYFGNTVLPIELDVADVSAKVTLKVTMGVCSEICVPAHGEFSLPVADKVPDAANGLRIRQALAEVPLPWPGEPTPVGDVEWSDAAKALVVSVDETAIDPASLIAAAVGSVPLFGAPQKSPQAGIVLLPVLGKSDNLDLQDLPVLLTFMTDRGAFEVQRVVGDTASAPVQ